MKTKPKLLIFNSGSGSGFQELVENSRTGVLDAEIVGLVTDNPKNTCVQRAIALKIPWVAISKKSIEAADYQALVKSFKADYVALSGWLRLVRGLDPRTTFNIHPGPLPAFGGKGMHGHHVHEAVLKAYREGKISASEICMHFVTEKYDEGPVFFRYPVPTRDDDNADSLGDRVNKAEHALQSLVTNLVVNGKVSWDGKDPKSLIVPDSLKQFECMDYNDLF